MSEWYAKKLLDPRWKAKRREVIKRDRHRCFTCGSEENLEVHHQRYIRGREPWEYDGYDLITL